MLIAYIGNEPEVYVPGIGLFHPNEPVLVEDPDKAARLILNANFEEVVQKKAVVKDVEADKPAPKPAKEVD